MGVCDRLIYWDNCRCKSMKYKKCNDCLAHYSGRHDCPPWLKALVKESQNNQKKQGL